MAKDGSMFSSFNNAIEKKIFVSNDFILTISLVMVISLVNMVRLSMCFMCLV